MSALSPTQAPNGAGRPTHTSTKGAPTRAGPLNRMQTYKFINEKLKGDTYSLGDAYEDSKLSASRKEWEDKNPKPYLHYVRQLSKTWPHLRLLADFMEVGTTPLRWDPDSPGGYAKDRRLLEQNIRWNMTNVCLLQYTSEGVLAPIRYKSSNKLEQGLAALPNDSSVKLRLFVVEDLSRNVIENLGSRFKIEPDFFRAHILDYAWYNIRDYWREPAHLDVVARKQKWFQVRFVRARYFESGAKFKEAFEAAQEFNVFRRPDDDLNNKAFWDKNEAKIGLTRSKATFWMRPSTDTEPAVAVLLLDPTTVNKGYPLWKGYRNWAKMPEMPDILEEKSTAQVPPSPALNGKTITLNTYVTDGEQETTDTPNQIDTHEYIPQGPRQYSFFEDFLYWAQRPEAFSDQDQSENSSKIHVPAEALLHLICSEWLTISDYVKTRLNQIDWEIAHPSDFLRAPVDQTLAKLHAWRRFVPLYREMLSDTLLRVFRVSPSSSVAMQGNAGSPTCPCLGSSRPNGDQTSTHYDFGVNAYRQDFELALSYMEEYQKRIDRLTHVATAAINIDDSRRGISDNSNLQRLTYLATFFIPMSFIAALMSMQPDLSQLTGTLITWAEAALPSGVFIMGFIFLVSMPRFVMFMRLFPWVGQWRPFRLK